MDLLYNENIEKLERKINKCKDAIIELNNSDLVGKVENAQRVTIRLNNFKQQKKELEELIKPVKVKLAI